MDFHSYCQLFPLHQETVAELAQNMGASGWLERSVIRGCGI